MQIKIIACILVLIAAFGFGWRQGSLSVQSEWDREKAEINAQTAIAVSEANERTRAIEADMNERLRQVTGAYSRKLQEKNNAENAAVERAATGGLFINAECPAASGELPNSTPSTDGSPRTARVKLPAKDGEFLIRLAAEADRITEQLTSCQSILEAERAK